jgi:hypothetical protein
MNRAIPKELVETDALLHGIMQEVSFSKYLNPTNVEAAKWAFLSGSHSPPFTYKPFTHADDFLRILDGIVSEKDHPVGQLLEQKSRSLRTVIDALKLRTEEAFDELAKIEEWYPDQDLLSMRFQAGHEETPMVHDAARMVEHLKEALAQRGLESWSIETDSVMAARVMVEGSKKLLRVHPSARFRESDLRRLVLHEIDVHAVRTHNGSRQTLRCFETGLPGSLLTEEGLAMVAERLGGIQSQGNLARQAEVVRAIDMGRRMGFRELYNDIRLRCGPNLAWSICLRIKRGLKRPELPGVYAKDSVYLAGWKHVEKWLAQGGDIRWLYVGKVGTHHPVGEWLEQGWIQLEEVPAVWKKLGA